MNEYLEQLYSKLGGDDRFGSINDFKSVLESNEGVANQLYSKIGGDDRFGSFDSYNQVLGLSPNFSGDTVTAPEQESKIDASKFESDLVVPKTQPSPDETDQTELSDAPVEPGDESTLVGSALQRLFDNPENQIPELPVVGEDGSVKMQKLSGNADLGEPYKEDDGWYIDYTSRAPKYDNQPLLANAISPDKNRKIYLGPTEEFVEQYNSLSPQERADKYEKDEKFKKQAWNAGSAKYSQDLGITNLEEFDYVVQKDTSDFYLTAKVSEKAVDNLSTELGLVNAEIEGAFPELYEKLSETEQKVKDLNLQVQDAINEERDTEELGDALEEEIQTYKDLLATTVVDPKTGESVPLSQATDVAAKLALEEEIDGYRDWVGKAYSESDKEGRDKKMEGLSKLADQTFQELGEVPVIGGLLESAERFKRTVTAWSQKPVGGLVSLLGYRMGSEYMMDLGSDMIDRGDANRGARNTGDIFRDEVELDDGNIAVVDVSDKSILAVEDQSGNNIEDSYNLYQTSLLDREVQEKLKDPENITRDKSLTLGRFATQSFDQAGEMGLALAMGGGFSSVLRKGFVKFAGKKALTQAVKTNITKAGTFGGIYINSLGREFDAALKEGLEPSEALKLAREKSVVEAGASIILGNLEAGLVGRMSIGQKNKLWKAAESLMSEGLSKGARNRALREVGRHGGKQLFEEAIEENLVEKIQGISDFKRGIGDGTYTWKDVANTTAVTLGMQMIMGGPAGISQLGYYSRYNDKDFRESNQFVSTIAKAIVEADPELIDLAPQIGKKMGASEAKIKDAQNQLKAVHAEFQDVKDGLTEEQQTEWAKAKIIKVDAELNEKDDAERFKVIIAADLRVAKIMNGETPSEKLEDDAGEASETVTEETPTSEETETPTEEAPNTEGAMPTEDTLAGEDIFGFAVVDGKEYEKKEDGNWYATDPNILIEDESLINELETQFEETLAEESEVDKEVDKKDSVYTREKAKEAKQEKSTKKPTKKAEKASKQETPPESEGRDTFYTDKKGNKVPVKERDGRIYLVGSDGKVARHPLKRNSPFSAEAKARLGDYSEMPDNVVKGSDNSDLYADTFFEKDGDNWYEWNPATRQRVKKGKVLTPKKNKSVVEGLNDRLEKTRETETESAVEEEAPQEEDVDEEESAKPKKSPATKEKKESKKETSKKSKPKETEQEEATEPVEPSEAESEGDIPQNTVVENKGKSYILQEDGWHILNEDESTGRKVSSRATKLIPELNRKALEGVEDTQTQEVVEDTTEESTPTEQSEKAQEKDEVDLIEEKFNEEGREVDVEVPGGKIKAQIGPDGKIYRVKQNGGIYKNPMTGKNLGKAKEAFRKQIMAEINGITKTQKKSPEKTEKAKTPKKKKESTPKKKSPATKEKKESKKETKQKPKKKEEESLPESEVIAEADPNFTGEEVQDTTTKKEQPKKEEAPKKKEAPKEDQPVKSWKNKKNQVKSDRKHVYEKIDGDYYKVANYDPDTKTWTPVENINDAKPVDSSNELFEELEGKTTKSNTTKSNKKEEVSSEPDTTPKKVSAKTDIPPEIDAQIEYTTFEGKETFYFYDGKKSVPYTKKNGKWVDSKGNRATEEIIKAAEYWFNTPKPKGIKQGAVSFYISPSGTKSYLIWNDGGWSALNPITGGSSSAATTNVDRIDQANINYIKDPNQTNPGKAKTTKKPDQVTKKLDEGIAEANKIGKMANALGIVPFLAEGALRTTKIAYLTGKSIFNAVKDGYQYLVDHGVRTTFNNFFDRVRDILSSVDVGNAIDSAVTTLENNGALALNGQPIQNLFSKKPVKGNTETKIAENNLSDSYETYDNTVEQVGLAPDNDKPKTTFSKQKEALQEVGEAILDFFSGMEGLKGNIIANEEQFRIQLSKLGFSNLNTAQEFYSEDSVIRDKPSFISDSGGTILGFYDPSTNKIYLDPSNLSPDTVVEELTHMLQFAIRSSALRGDSRAQGILNSAKKLLMPEVKKIAAGAKTNKFGIDLSPYKKGEFETDENFQERIFDELWAKLSTPNSIQSIKDKLSQSKTPNKGLQRVLNVFNRIKNWFLDSVGFKGGKNPTISELIEQTSDELIKGRFFQNLEASEVGKQIEVNSKRLSKEEESGRDASGNLNGQATLILHSIRENTSDPVARQAASETAIAEFAEANNVWFPNASPENSVPATEGIQEALDSIALQNANLDTNTEVVGFGYVDGQFSVITNQAPVDGSVASNSQIARRMASKGFKKDGDTYFNDDVILDNVEGVKASDGRVLITSADAKLNTIDQGRGGNRTINDDVSVDQFAVQHNLRFNIQENKDRLEVARRNGWSEEQLNRAREAANKAKEIHRATPDKEYDSGSVKKAFAEKAKREQEIRDALNATGKFKGRDKQQQIEEVISVFSGVAKSWAKRYNKRPVQFYSEVLAKVDFTTSLTADGIPRRGKISINNTGRFVITVTQSSDVRTPIHELAHLFEHFMTVAEKNKVAKWYYGDQGTWNNSTELREAFANGFLAFIAEQSESRRKPKHALSEIFKKFKNQIYKLLDGVYNYQNGKSALNYNIREIYNTMSSNIFPAKPPNKTGSELNKREDAWKQVKEQRLALTKSILEEIISRIPNKKEKKKSRITFSIGSNADLDAAAIKHDYSEIPQAVVAANEFLMEYDEKGRETRNLSEVQAKALEIAQNNLSQLIEELKTKIANKKGDVPVTWINDLETMEDSLIDISSALSLKGSLWGSLGQSSQQSPVGVAKKKYKQKTGKDWDTLDNSQQKELINLEKELMDNKEEISDLQKDIREGTVKQGDIDKQEMAAEVQNMPLIKSWIKEFKAYTRDKLLKVRKDAVEALKKERKKNTDLFDTAKEYAKKARGLYEDTVSASYVRALRRVIASVHADESISNTDTFEGLYDALYKIDPDISEHDLYAVLTFSDPKKQKKAASEAKKKKRLVDKEAKLLEELEAHIRDTILDKPVSETEPLVPTEQVDKLSNYIAQVMHLASLSEIDPSDLAILGEKLNAISAMYRDLSIESKDKVTQITEAQIQNLESKLTKKDGIKAILEAIESLKKTRSTKLLEQRSKKLGVMLDALDKGTYEGDAAFKYFNFAREQDADLFPKELLDQVKDPKSKSLIERYHNAENINNIITAVFNVISAKNTNLTTYEDVIKEVMGYLEAHGHGDITEPYILNALFNRKKPERTVNNVQEHVRELKKQGKDLSKLTQLLEKHWDKGGLGSEDQSIDNKKKADKAIREVDRVIKEILTLSSVHEADYFLKNSVEELNKELLEIQNRFTAHLTKEQAEITLEGLLESIRESKAQERVQKLKEEEKDLDKKLAKFKEQSDKLKENPDLIDQISVDYEFLKNIPGLIPKYMHVSVQEALDGGTLGATDGVQIGIREKRALLREEVKNIVLNQIKDFMASKDADKQGKAFEYLYAKHAIDKDKKIKSKRLVQLTQRNIGLSAKLKEKYENIGSSRKSKFLDLLNTPRLMTLAADLSFIAYQGGLALPFLMTNPNSAKNVFGSLIRGLYHEAKNTGYDLIRKKGSGKRDWFEENQANLRNRKYYEDGVVMGLNLIDENNMLIEDALHLRSVIEDIPIAGKGATRIRRFSERVYITYLNNLRYEMFEKGMDSFFTGDKVHNEVAAREWAEYVNTVTGSMRRFSKNEERNKIANETIKYSAYILTAPRLYASSFKSLWKMAQSPVRMSIDAIRGGVVSEADAQSFLDKDFSSVEKRKLAQGESDAAWRKIARHKVAKAHTKNLLFYAGWYGIVNAIQLGIAATAMSDSDDEEEKSDYAWDFIWNNSGNPLSSKFMKLQVGRWVMTTFPHAAYIRHTADFVASPFMGEDAKYKSLQETVGGFAKYKVSPIANSLNTLIYNRDFLGRLQTDSGTFPGWLKRAGIALEQAAVPIMFQGVVKGAVNGDFGVEAVEGLADFFGISTYTEDPYRDFAVQAYLESTNFTPRYYMGENYGNSRLTPGEADAFTGERIKQEAKDIFGRWMITQRRTSKNPSNDKMREKFKEALKISFRKFDQPLPKTLKEPLINTRGSRRSARSIGRISRPSDPFDL